MSYSSITTFRLAYDTLVTHQPSRADKEYLRVLHLAASTNEVDVDAALTLLAESRTVPSFASLRELVRRPQGSTLLALIQPTLDFQVYDALLGTRCADG